jgi:hypothetical protein
VKLYRHRSMSCIYQLTPSIAAFILSVQMTISAFGFPRMPGDTLNKIHFLFIDY